LSRYCDYKLLCKSVEVGQKILVADGRWVGVSVGGDGVCVLLSSAHVTYHCSLSLLVTAKDPAGVFVTVRVLNTAKIGAKKNMNLPMCEVHLPALSEQDKKDLA